MANHPNYDVAKIAFEVLAEDLGKRYGNTSAAREAADFMRKRLGPHLAKVLANASGIVGAAALKIDNFPGIDQFFRKIDVNPAGAKNVLNEMIDQGVRKLGEAVGNNAAAPGAPVMSDVEVRLFMREKLPEILERYNGHETQSVGEKLIWLKNIIGTSTDKHAPAFEVHDGNCPACDLLYQDQLRGQKQGKGKQDTSGATSKKPDAVIRRPLSYALENKFPATMDACCSGSVQKLFQAAREVKLDLFGLVERINRPTLAKRFYEIITVPAESAIEAEFQRIAKLDTWANKEQVLIRTLDRCIVDPHAGLAELVAGLRKAAAAKPRTRMQEAAASVEETVGTIADVLSGKSSGAVQQTRDIVAAKMKDMEAGSLEGYWQQQALNRALEGED